MCGILGFWSCSLNSKNVFDKQLHTLTHRGPDNTSIKHLDNLSLGHTRLAVIDIEASSNQPMSSSCGNLTIVFNGEIYNFLELRAELKDYGFQTSSDTEVILAAYLKWGVTCVHHFNGMFAFAIHDKRENIMFLARDPIGKKPLYYSQQKNYFAFGSEIKALIGLPGIQAELNPQAVNQYFSSGYIGGQKTLYKNIFQLEAGHFAVFPIQNDAKLKITKYWNLGVTNFNNSHSEDDLIEEIDEILNTAVKSRLQSDVPLGAFLSGGLDSSLIVAIAARHTSTPLNTFTISFPGMSNDEAEYARKIAEFFGTRHVVREISCDFLTCLKNLIPNLDQPFADSSIIPTSLLCEEARKSVTVALSGDGGDELFAGYGHYDYFAWEHSMRTNLPLLGRKAIGKLATFLPERHKTNMIKRLVFDDQKSSIGAHASRFFNFQERQRLLTDSISADPMPENEFLAQFNDDEDWLQNICKIDFQNYMVDDILVKVDRLSMLHSLEIRSPLLDKRIAEIMFSKVPSNMKRKGKTKKYLLKKIAQRYLPQDFSFQRKSGFGVPLGPWFQNELGDRLLNILKSSPSGYINEDEALRYLRSHRRGFSNHSKKLFSILIWEEWFASKGSVITSKP